MEVKRYIAADGEGYGLISEEVKQIVMGVESLNYSMAIPDHHFRNNPRSGIDCVEESKRYAVMGLCESIEKFVKVKVIKNRQDPYAVATIHLPFVYDDKVQRLQRQVTSAVTRADNTNRRNDRLQSYIESLHEYLKLPWYKKLWKKWDDRVQRNIDEKGVI